MKMLQYTKRENSATGKLQIIRYKITVLVVTDKNGNIPLDSDGKVDLSKNTNETPEGGTLLLYCSSSW